MPQEPRHVLQLKRLKENYFANNDEALADALGITTRTLSDFMKVKGGREPTDTLQKLIDILSGEIESMSLIRAPRLNLVLISGDFRVPGDGNPVETVVDMHRGGSLNNEYHFISVTPGANSQLVRFAEEALGRRRVTPHFFSCEPGYDSQAAVDSYFTVTATWLASQAAKRDLAHITLAADLRKFWLLARELKRLFEVGVTMIRQASDQEDPGITALLRSHDISVADPRGRKFGRVQKLLSDTASGQISYGFIDPVDVESNHQIAPGSALFFSHMHMRKLPHTDDFEVRIAELSEGDIVSFDIGMNYKGPCAVDVALVKPAATQDRTRRAREDASSTSQMAAEPVDIISALQDAVSVCADEDGWALMSRVGQRLRSMPNYKGMMRAASANKISQIVDANPDLFEQSGQDGAGTRYSAACIRARQSKKASNKS